MRRAPVFFAVLCLLLFCGCGEPRRLVSADRVAPITMTGDQKELLNLIGAPGEILLFEVAVKQPYARFDAWVELYHRGELVEPHIAGVSLSADDPQPWEGKLAVVLSDDSCREWKVTFSSEGGITSGTGETEQETGLSSRAFGPIAEPVPVEPGAETVLYTSIHTEQDGISVYDAREYVRNPSLLAEYEYIYVVRCRFE